MNEDNTPEVEPTGDNLEETTTESTTAQTDDHTQEQQGGYVDLIEYVNQKYVTDDICSRKQKVIDEKTKSEQGKSNKHKKDDDVIVELPDFGAGDTVTVYYQIQDVDKTGKVKTRTQFFKGVVIQKRGAGATQTFTVRKMSGSIGVERVFPINMPTLEKLEVNRRGRVRRKRIFYFRGLTGKKARIKEKVVHRKTS